MARSPSPLPPAFALVAACTLLDDDGALERLAPSLISHPDFAWERLASLAFYHEVEELVRVRLEKAAPGAIPPDLLARMQHTLVWKSALQSAQTAISARVTGALATAGIPAVLIKGVALSHLLYAPNPEFRASNDIDIVVAPEDLAAADRVLREAGLARTWPVSEPPEAARPMLLQLANVFEYRGPVFNELIELHCRPTLNPYWLPVPFAALLASSTEIATEHGRLRALDGPLNVFYLCQHALYNLVDFRLKWFGDIARAVRRAGAADCAGCIAEYPAALPRRPGLLADEVLGALANGSEQGGPDAVRIVRRMVRAEGIPAGRSLSQLPVEFAYNALVLRHLPGWRGKARQLLIALSDPRDAVSLRLSPRFAVVYALAGPLLSLFRFMKRGRRSAHSQAEGAGGL